jgi:hypothetical protein
MARRLSELAHLCQICWRHTSGLPVDDSSKIEEEFNLGFLANLVVRLFGGLYGRNSRLDRMMEAAVEALFYLTGPFVKKLFELSPAVYARMCSYLLS